MRDHGEKDTQGCAKATVMKLHQLANALKSYKPSQGRHSLGTEELDVYFTPLLTRLRALDSTESETVFLIIVNILMKAADGGDRIYLHHADTAMSRLAIGHGHVLYCREEEYTPSLVITRRPIRTGQIELDVSPIDGDLRFAERPDATFILSSDFTLLEDYIRRIQSKRGFWGLARLTDNDRNRFADLQRDVAAIHVVAWLNFGNETVAAFVRGIDIYEV